MLSTYRKISYYNIFPILMFRDFKLKIKGFIITITVKKYNLDEL